MTDFSHYSAYYPFITSLQVASETGSPDLAFAGAGGGAFVLDVSDEDDPKPWTGGPATGLRAPGLCRRVVLGPDQSVYLAMSKGGVVAFSRSGWGQTLSIPTQGDVRAVDVAPTGTPGEHLIVIGSHEAAGGGRLELYLASQPSTLLDAKTLPQGVEVVRVSQALSAGNTTVLVGLACGGVLRYEIPIGGPHAFGNVTASWTAGSVFVRDLVVDELHNRAYVAGFSKGVFALDLQSRSDAGGSAVADSGDRGRFAPVLDRRRAGRRPRSTRGRAGGGDQPGDEDTRVRALGVVRRRARNADRDRSSGLRCFQLGKPCGGSSLAFESS